MYIYNIHNAVAYDAVLGEVDVCIYINICLYELYYHLECHVIYRIIQHISLLF
jgi:hypothetical protein